MKELPLVSFFCGAGGLDLGFRQAGFGIQLAYDSDAAAVQTHNRNFGPTAIEANIAGLSVDKVARHWQERTITAPIGVIGGPPCQAFSVANVNQSVNDPRRRLTAHFARLILGLLEEFNVDFFVFENVPGLVGVKHVDRYASFRERLSDSFHIYEHMLDAQDFGVPQRRRRFFVIGLNKSKFSEVQIDPLRYRSTGSVTVADAIRHLPDATHFERGLSSDRIPYHPNHWCMKPKSAKFGSTESTGRSFRKLKWEDVSPTVAYGNREVHVHPTGARRLSVLEAMLLQGFPEDFVLTGNLSSQIRMISQAVAPPVAGAVARAIRSSLYE